MSEMKKLLITFSEEARERIADLESGLLQLEESPGDKELLNSIFRAAHTIKGTSSSLGYKHIASFTHALEEVLDLVRKERLLPTKGLITVFLKATDALRDMIDSILSDVPYDVTQWETLMEDINALKQPDHIDTERDFKIIFTPRHDSLRKGNDPARAIARLKSIGKIKHIKSYTDDLPKLAEFDPDELYLRWDILLCTSKDKDEIRNIFSPAEEGTELKIFSLAEQKKEPLLGEMLIKEGTVKAEDVATALKEQKRLGDILIDQNKINLTDMEQAVEKQRLKKIELFKNAVSSTIRVDLKKLDQLLNSVGEMIIVHSTFDQTLQALLGPGESRSSCFERDASEYQYRQRLEIIFSQLQRIGRDIQENTLALRMLPVGEVFQRFARLVRELSGSSGKKVNLCINGEGTELDKGVLERITDPLVHLIRNAIDHGIETPDERVAQGKPAHGMIHLSAYQVAESVHIEIEDDGRGLDRDEILAKAIEKGLAKSGDFLTDDQIFSFIFLPDFSTADQVTDTSGRGVGMDVVKKSIEGLNGNLAIRTKKANGTTLSIRLPLTLAIIDGLSVNVGDEVFIIPINSVIESLRPRKDSLSTVQGSAEVVNVRGDFIPLARLHEFFSIEPRQTDPEKAIVILLSHGNRKCCLLVDDIIGQQQVVIKTLGKAMPASRTIAGGTILGNGRVALVLDPAGIISRTLTAA